MHVTATHGCGCGVTVSAIQPGLCDRVSLARPGMCDGQCNMARDVTVSVTRPRMCDGQRDMAGMSQLV